MSDIRTLLKAKRDEIRIAHPLAYYSNSGQLKCTACGTTVKHSSAWEGHLGSKAHRTNAARLKEEERLKESQGVEERSRGKRSAKELEEPDVKKRRVEGESKGLGTGNLISVKPSMKPSSVPDDFFSDPSKAPTLAAHDDSADEAELDDSLHPISPAGKSLLDMELEAFEKAMSQAPDYRETYERATVIAEPVLAIEPLAGFPSQGTGNVGTDTPIQGEEKSRLQREQDDR
jgi:zinc finger protein 830